MAIKKKQVKNGFSLLEVMLSVFVIMVGLVSVYGLLPRLIDTTFDSKDRFIAAQLAQEAVEIARNFRDSNWLSGNEWNLGFTDCSAETGCEIDYLSEGFSAFMDRHLLIDSNGFYNYQSGTETRFKRKIIITSNDWQKEMEIRVEIYSPSDFSPFIIISNLYSWI